MEQRVIYDLGANNGDDIPYYLLRSERVVAVEANPALCELIRTRFGAEIEAGRLTVENCVVAAEGGGGAFVDFHIHRANHVLSQLTLPAAAAEFDKVTLPARTVAEIIRRHGDPYYVKIDIEHYDAEILRALFQAGIFPPFVSAEAHSVEVFALLVAQGRYNAFKLVDGYSVSSMYADRVFAAEKGGDPIRYSFPFHSAGPFGNDVDGEWQTADDFLRVLALEGLGWKDIHATNKHLATPAASPPTRDWLLRFLARQLTVKKNALVSRLRNGQPLGHPTGNGNS